MMRVFLILLTNGTISDVECQAYQILSVISERLNKGKRSLVTSQPVNLARHEATRFLARLAI